jgi:hypothetical protein
MRIPAIEIYTKNFINNKQCLINSHRVLVVVAVRHMRVITIMAEIIPCCRHDDTADRE